MPALWFFNADAELREIRAELRRKADSGDVDSLEARVALLERDGASQDAVDNAAQSIKRNRSGLFMSLGLVLFAQAVSLLSFFYFK